MRKIIIFGNSGSGKSTLARKLAKAESLAHLDLDTLAWLPSMPPERTPLIEANSKIRAFINSNKYWVIEGCYTDLLEFVVADASDVIFMDLSVEKCIENAKNRPWETHKYESKEAQDNNLRMLIDWIEDYGKREDVFSYQAHSRFFENFSGTKVKYINNQKNT